MRGPTGRIKGLGEIALRVSDLDAMRRFYQEVVGLEVMRRADNAVFFRITDGYGGHTQVLALFDRSGQADYRGLDPERTTVDHIAFEIDLGDYEAEKARLEGLGVRVTTAEHAWVRWRSVSRCGVGDRRASGLALRDRPGLFPLGGVGRLGLLASLQFLEAEGL